MQGYCTSCPDSTPTSLRAQTWKKWMLLKGYRAYGAKNTGEVEHLQPLQQSQPFTPDVQTKVYFLENLNQRNAGNGGSRGQ